MNFKGRATFQTQIGAIFSILIVIFVTSYSLLKFQEFVYREQPFFIKNTVLHDMYEHFPEALNAKDNFFELAIGFLKIEPYKFKAHDPRIGQLNARMVQMDQQGEHIIFKKFPLETRPCKL